ncbi:MAG: TonB-dependent receptor [Myxococcota bacterium]
MLGGPMTAQAWAQEVDDEPSEAVDAEAVDAVADLEASGAEPTPEETDIIDVEVGGDDDGGAADEDPIEVRVEGPARGRSTQRGASSFEIGRDVLDLAPTQEGADVFRRTPGLFMARASGLAVGHRYMLRGFDADHGQDLDLRVGDLPINLPSHIHGQGYADVGMIIGEVVDRLQVTEGVYDPVQGDFAIAGSIDAKLGVRDRGWRLKSGYGAFDTFRQLGVWAPEGQARETFGAVQYQRTGGYGSNRQAQSASAIAQLRLGEGAWTYRTLGIFYGARGSFPGVLRRDDIERGDVDFYGIYPFATAEKQSALNARVMLGGFADYRGRDDDGRPTDNGQVGVYLGYDNFRLQQNFTGFTQESRVLNGLAGRGDLIEQQNRTLTFGLTGRYRSRRYEPFSWLRGTVELGTSARIDDIEQAQNLIDAAVRSQTWDQRVDASIRGLDVGLWGDLDWLLSTYVRARVGVRGNVLLYDVDDRLGNFVPATRPDEAFIVGFRRSALGFAVGPRASLEALPASWVSIKAAYGEGYRSPQARTLEDGERAPFTKVRSADLGATLRADTQLEVTVAGFYTQLSDDVAFEAREGRLERVGESRRLGVTVYAESRPTSWLLAAFSLTYVQATLLEPPPPTAEEPSPPFEPGQSLPFVPPVVARIDLGADYPLVEELGDHDLTGRLGSGLSYLGPRPLPFGGAARPVSLLDANAALGWGPFTLDFALYNILDSEYAAAEFNFPSDWNPNGPRSRVPARHIAAGPPRSWMATLEVSL